MSGVGSAQDSAPIEIAKDRHDVLAAGTRGIPENSWGQGCDAGELDCPPFHRLVRRGRVREVDIEDDDPASSLERTDADARAVGDPGGLGQRWRCRDGKRALEAVHGEFQGRINGGW